MTEQMVEPGSQRDGGKKYVVQAFEVRYACGATKTVCCGPQVGVELAKGAVGYKPAGDAKPGTCCHNC